MYERAGASVKRACADVRAAGHALEADRGEMDVKTVYQFMKEFNHYLEGQIEELS